MRCCLLQKITQHKKTRVKAFASKKYTTAERTIPICCTDSDTEGRILLMFGLNHDSMRKVIEYLLHIIPFAFILGAAGNGTILFLCFGLLLVIIAYLLLQILQRLDR